MKVKSIFKNIQVISDDIDEIYSLFALVNIQLDGISRCHSGKLKIKDIKKFGKLSVHDVVTGITTNVFDKFELSGSIYKFKFSEYMEEAIKVKQNWYAHIPNNVFEMDISGHGMILLVNYYCYIGISNNIWLHDDLIDYFSGGESIVNILNNLSKCGACEEVVFVNEPNKTSYLMVKKLVYTNFEEKKKDDKKKPYSRGRHIL